MHNILFPLLLFISSLAQAQEITVYAGTNSQKVLPETAQKFNLTQSQILTQEEYAKIWHYDVDLRVAQRDSADAGSIQWWSDSISYEERYIQERNGTRYNYRAEPLTVTGDGSPEHPYNPQTSSERIIALADELQATDPLTAVMLRIVAGSTTDPDPQAREKLSTLMVVFAQKQIKQVMDGKIGN